MNGIMAGEIVLSAILAFVFLASAVPKLRHPRGFALAVLEYHVLPPSLGRVYARLLPPIELLAALLLVSGTVVRVAAGVAAVLLSSFLIAISINLARGRNLDCGCFGKSHNRRIGPGLLLQDATLLGASMVLMALSSEWLTLARWSVFRLAGLPAAYTSVAIFVCASVVLAGSALARRSRVRGRRWRSSAAGS